MIFPATRVWNGFRILAYRLTEKQLGDIAMEIQTFSQFWYNNSCYHFCPCFRNKEKRWRYSSHISRLFSRSTHQEQKVETNVLILCYETSNKTSHTIYIYMEEINMVTGRRSSFSFAQIQVGKVVEDWHPYVHFGQLFQRGMTRTLPSSFHFNNGRARVYIRPYTPDAL